jgi:hypothetical protein
VTKRAATELTDEQRSVAERHCLRWKELLDEKARAWHRIGNGDPAAREDLDELYRMILAYVSRQEGSERIDAHLARRHGSRTMLARRSFAKRLLDAWLRHGANVQTLLGSDDGDVVEYVADSLYLDAGMLIAALRSEAAASLITPSEREKQSVSLTTAASFLQEIGSGYGSARTEKRDRKRFWNEVGVSWPRGAKAVRSVTRKK